MSTSAKSTRRLRASTAAPIEMCSVQVGDTLFGLPISHILEIVGSARPQPVPMAPGFVGGLVHYRGDVLTTISPATFLACRPWILLNQSSSSKVRAGVSACWWIPWSRC
jgi:purine-binding chemotaxis protein CheW